MRNLKKRGFSWIGILIITAILVLLSLPAASCKSKTPTTPEPSEEREYYDFTATYIRTSIMNQKFSDPSSLELVINGKVRMILFVKLDEYRFEAEINSLPTHLKDEQTPSDAIYIVDTKRWVEYWVEVEGGPTYGKPHSVGDKVILKNKKTGVETELTKIVPNIYMSSLPAECEPKMAQFKVLKGGIVVNE